MKLQGNNTGTFIKQNSVTFDASLWAPTNGTINWNSYPNQIPYTESDVFHTQLTHTPASNSDIGWTIRIGKGGQIYYIDLQGLGQIICPQRSFSPWNDDCMTTTIYSSDVVNNDAEMGGNDSYANGYIHGSGMYIKPNMDPLNNKPFYNPILGERFDPSDRSYSIINWGLVPKPSINRGDVLFYSRYRDIGNGVLEITFYCYNFGTRVYNFAETPWFACKPSKFPNMITGVAGTSSYVVNNKTFQSGAISSSGGWGAYTVNPNNSNSATCALVWGTNTASMAVNFGVVDTGVRDMSLIAPSKSAMVVPGGSGVRYRRYIVFGKLQHVSDVCAKLNPYCFFETLELSKNYSGKLAIYQTTREGQQTLTANGSGTPVAYTFPIPVKDSLPLMLMKNNNSGSYFLSTDPYTACGKLPFNNPYPIGHPKYNSYQNKHIYQVYDGKTSWIELLGFVLPLDESQLSNGYRRLSDILTGISFQPGEKLAANQLMLYSQ